MINVALLGSGFMGATHAAGYAALGDRVCVRTVCARSEADAARVAESTGARVTTDLEAAIDDPEIDVVDVCLPTPLHRRAAERAFAAGKHVFLEKPIALTAEDAAAILDAAAQSRRILMVGLVLRFWPEYVELQRRLASDELGRPLVVSARRLSPAPDWSEWIADPAQSGGVPVDLMIHDFDQLNWLLGKPRSVFAREEGPGHVHAIVEYDSAVGAVEGSLQMPPSYGFSSGILVHCEAGVAEYSFSAVPIAGESNIGVPSSPNGLRLYPADGDARTIDLEPADPWAAELAYFVDCVERERPPEQGTGEQANLALEVSLAASRSLASGRPETIA